MGQSSKKTSKSIKRKTSSKEKKQETELSKIKKVNQKDTDSSVNLKDKPKDQERKSTSNEDRTHEKVKQEAPKRTGWWNKVLN